MNRTYSMAAAIKPLKPGTVLAGQARTVTSMVGDNGISHAALALVNRGEVLVIDAGGYEDVAVWGAIMTHAAIARDIAGVVIDGAVRDAAEIRELGFSCYARANVPSGPHKGFGGIIDGPISCAGCPVKPGDIVIGDDDGIAVVDKPHFLATIPRGMHVTETATVRLRRLLDCPHLTPAHRLDRATAGVLIFTRTADLRRPYQELFSSRSVLKEYEAVAGCDPELDFPRTVRSRIEKDHGVMVAREEPGEPNSETRIELIETMGEWARYRLFPHTGRTHQLRIHMSSLGIPIKGDPYYPVFTRTAADDFSAPLQLLARAIEFDDPVTGERRRFESQRNLVDR
nr:pseudouridine synthase [uncultured Rhodococcus sp.]